VVTFTVAGRDADDTLLEGVLLAGLDEHAQALFAQVMAIECGSVLLRFLDAAADSMSTTDGIAFRLNQPDPVVEGALNAFEKLGLVRRMNLDGLIFWRMVTDSETRRLARNLVTWQNRWLARLMRAEQFINGRTLLGNLRAQ
jgi:hypothetical protein